MAGHEPFDDPSLKGISRYFNNTTIRGRANVITLIYFSLNKTPISFLGCNGYIGRSNFIFYLQKN